MRILCICGSLQEKSGNRTLLEIASTAASADVAFEFFDGLEKLPAFNPDIEACGEAPPEVLRWRRAISSSDALLIASPEYGHSMPGALKNAIDWTIGTGELEGKIVAVTAAVPDAERGRMGLQALRQTLGAVRATVVGGEPIARGPTFQANVAGLTADLLATVARTTAH